MKYRISGNLKQAADINYASSSARKLRQKIHLKSTVLLCLVESLVSSNNSHLGKMSGALSCERTCVKALCFCQILPVHLAPTLAHIISCVILQRRRFGLRFGDSFACS